MRFLVLVSLGACRPDCRVLLRDGLLFRLQAQNTAGAFHTVFLLVYGDMILPAHPLVRKQLPVDFREHLGHIFLSAFAAELLPESVIIKYDISILICKKDCHRHLLNDGLSDLILLLSGFGDLPGQYTVHIFIIYDRGCQISRSNNDDAVSKMGVVIDDDDANDDQKYNDDDGKPESKREFSCH